MRQRQTGFTLVELMIVVAIVAILAGIGYPSYSSYIQTANRNDAKAALYKLVNMQEQHFLDFDRYATTLVKDASGALPGWSDGTDYYDFALDASSSETSYTAVATATGKQVTDTDCNKFFINQFNVTSAANHTGVSNDDCW